MEQLENNPHAQLTIDFQPSGRRIMVPSGTILLDAAQKAGVDLAASCGGAGFCGACLIQVKQGDVTPLSKTERELLDEAQLNHGFRLACQTGARSDARIWVPQKSLVGAQHLQIEGIERGFQPCPDIIAIDLEINAPELFDLQSDLRRVDNALKRHNLFPLNISPAGATLLSNFLRQHEWKTRLVLREKNNYSEMITCRVPGEKILGLALDIGSTKIAMYLVDLETGVTLAKSGFLNPQIGYGEDVVSRIAFSNRSPENFQLLHQVLVDVVNQGAVDLCLRANAKVEQIVDLVAVGNTAIHHFFCGLPVEQLGRAPYVSVVQNAMQFYAAEIGLKMAPYASVYLPPIIAGFVGADHVAALTMTYPYAKEGAAILVDIGTNTEISLIHAGDIYSCSCASGPAFEGAHIHDGMRAIPGAIDRVKIVDGEILVYTIGGNPPLGLCGSGILSAIAEMVSNKLIDRRGTIGLSSQVKFELVTAQASASRRPIIITRKDIHEIQLAKAAIRAGIEILLRHGRLEASEIDQWILAGAFGTHIDLDAAIRIGMFPDQPLERFHQVGNAAGMGSRQMLLSTAQRDLSASFIDRVNYIELTTEPNFQDIYIDSLFFPVQN